MSTRSLRRRLTQYLGWFLWNYKKDTPPSPVPEIRITAEGDVRIDCDGNTRVTADFS